MIGVVDVKSTLCAAINVVFGRVGVAGNVTIINRTYYSCLNEYKYTFLHSELLPVHVRSNPFDVNPSLSDMKDT